VLVLMLLLGTFEVGIGSVRFLMSGYSTLLRIPIPVPIYPDVTSYMNVRSDGHMMHVLERLRELALFIYFIILGRQHSWYVPREKKLQKLASV